MIDCGHCTTTVNLTMVLWVACLRFRQCTEMKASKTQEAASCIDVKARLTRFDRDGLLGLVHDLYTANKDDPVFLHARFGLGEDVLKPYKTSINRCVWPDMFPHQDASVAEAKKSIANYKKAMGQTEGLGELMVFSFMERLDAARRISQKIGHGVDDAMSTLLTECRRGDEAGDVEHQSHLSCPARWSSSMTSPHVRISCAARPRRGAGPTSGA